MCIEKCERCVGLSMESLPDGAMYALVKIDCERFRAAGMTDSVAFTALFSEESVLVLPGQCFWSVWIRESCFNVPNGNAL